LDLRLAIMADTKEVPLNAVQVEALAVMKIIKHCTGAFPTIATGSIVGMDNGSTLEITSSFPFPTADVPQSDLQHQNDHTSASTMAAAAPRAKANIAYQNEMIKYLREVNVDAQNCGFYTSSNLGNFVTPSFIENIYHFQSQTNERIVALVHDVSKSAQGALSLRAFRLSPAFMAAYKEGVAKFTTEK
jgi:translation initiation factor 3 subunit H